MCKINKDMNVFEVLDKYPQLEDIFYQNDLPCIGCPGSAMESIEDAATGHGIDLEKLLDEINQALK